MGQAFDQDGRVIAEAYGATKREVFDKLITEQPDAHEIRIRALTKEARTMEGLKPGRIVYFVFGQASAENVELRRSDYQRVGNTVACGDIYPAMVVRVCDECGTVNLKVMLDGNDDFWAASVPFDAAKGVDTWHWMFEGQSTRYRPDRTESAAAPSERYSGGQ